MFKKLTIDVVFITSLIFCSGFIGYMIKCISLNLTREVQWSTVEQSDSVYLIHLEND